MPTLTLTLNPGPTSSPRRVDLYALAQHRR